MLRYFFEKADKSNANLFRGMKISSAGDEYISEMGQYPVVKLTLKAVEGSAFRTAISALKIEIENEFMRHDYLLESPKISDRHKTMFRSIVSGSASMDEYIESLRLLTNCLIKHYEKKVIVLIDEYDVPLEKAYFGGYYDEMLEVIRAMYHRVLKSNDSLYFSVLTGCLRITKESIFTGLNNLNVISILSERFGEYFGFTEQEVKEMLSYYNKDDRMDEAGEWYNGYHFGRTNVYNPWSIIKYVDDLIENNHAYPSSHWSNTSANEIIRNLIEISDEDTKTEIEELIHGGSIEKPIHEDISYGEIQKSMDNLWNFLFFTGYLKKTGESYINRERYCTLMIPNAEVLCIYEEKTKEWFKEKVSYEDSAMITRAIMGKDIGLLTTELNKRLVATISFYDNVEAFYHGFLLGILSGVKGYSVKSNRETGLGGSDIYMRVRGSNYGAAIFELKIAKTRGKMKEACNQALEQIEKKSYAAELEKEGYRDILCYGVAFCGKECIVKADQHYSPKQNKW
jgi:hypothetical protein